MAGIWPRLKTTLLSTGNGKSRRSGRRMKSKANPYSSRGLEKFAALLDGIQGASLVERTASSLCAARSISRSAQEWTAATLVRSASRCSSERRLAAFEALAPTKVENLERDHVSKDHAENSSEERQVQEASSSLGPVGIRSLPERRSRRQVCSSKSKSAFVVLSAMGAFLSTQFKPLAAVLTFRAVIQVWHKGKLSARLMFSSAALYFLTPLRSYLVTHMPTRLNILPQNPEPQNPEIVISEPSSTLEFPAESAVEESPVLLPFLESTSVSMTVSTGASSKSRRLAKKIASRLKKMKMFRSSSSSEGSHHPTVSEPSSPDRHRMCPFSKRSRSIDTGLEDLSSSRKCIVMRRQRSSDSMVCKKSKLGRRLSSETLEEYNLSECSSASSSLHCKPASSEEVVGNAASPSSRNEVSWPVVGLLITLLFLLVGRFPAIMATSLFFVVVSHDGAHSSRGRDNKRALEAARKLQRRPQRWTSPLRR